MAQQSYDFIIVGAGTAGCLLAHRLSHSAKKPSVLLLEAGSKPSGAYLSAPFHRYHAQAMRPDLDHGYVSEPEPGLNGRQIPYTRGKGLGGSSILNFAVYLYGSSEDYNRWAEFVGDEEGEWSWETVHKSFGKIENYDFEGSKGYKHLADPSTNPHGTAGNVEVGLPKELEGGAEPQIEALVKEGWKVNLDLNSGDPVGVGIFPSSYSRQGKTTSATAHLLDAPENVHIWTDAKVAKFVWAGKKVVGIVTEDGRNATAKKEVIICGGAIDTPKLLLLNGIGPADELSPLGIDVKVNLPGVGKGLHDHVLTFMSVEVGGSINDRYAFESNEKLMAEAEAAWEKDQTGAFALQNSGLWGGFVKLPGLEKLKEFENLPKDVQEYLTKDKVPTFEFIANSTLWPPGTQLESGNTYLTFIAFLMNPQSTGSITLRSAKAEDKPVIKLNYLTHPYDKRIFREAIRETWTKLTSSRVIAPHVVRTILGPNSMDDADVDAFARENASTVWHAGGTCRMGKDGDEGAVVDKGFRAQCGGAATPAAGAGGYWQYHTTTYVETVGLLTKTSVFSTYVPATATQTCKDSQNPCGSTCCDSGYYCLTAGQCALIAGGSSGGIVPTGTLAPSAPLRPTSSGIVVVTYTGTPTVTVPFQTPIPTGASGSLVPTQESNNGLSGGAIAGIVIGHGGAKKGLGLAAGLGGLALALGLKRRHDAKAEDKSTTVSGTSYMYSDYTSTTQALRIATLAEHTTRQDDDRLSVVDVFLLYNFFASLRVEFPRVP
ncbi:BetA Choline dehydrogenase [Pyrenophora tritici-repentis]|nr:BetA Choline dehydrogenase [Pyrenophora tritici-repentis]KAI1592259.1 BetA Choline dehydrogenase [Pyrenophora tritici-repentis]